MSTRSTNGGGTVLSARGPVTEVRDAHAILNSLSLIGSMSRPATANDGRRGPDGIIHRNELGDERTPVASRGPPAASNVMPRWGRRGSGGGRSTTAARMVLFS